MANSVLTVCTLAQCSLLVPCQSSITFLIRCLPLHLNRAVTIADKMPKKNNKTNITRTPISHFLTTESENHKTEMSSVTTSFWYIPSSG